MSILKVGVLLTVLTALFVGLGQLIGGTTGAIIAFGLALLMNFGSYWYSDKMVLKMYGAQPLERSQAPQLYSMTEQMAQRAGIPMPSCISSRTRNRMLSPRDATRRTRRWPSTEVCWTC
jgi:heat shock protein HtpX